MVILIDPEGNKYMQVSVNTRLTCVRHKCAWNDSGVCFHTGTVEIGNECGLYDEEKPEPVLPKDYEDPACSSGRRCWVTARFYGHTPDEVVLKKAAYRKEYPTEGYSTGDCGPIFKTADNFYCGVMSRFSSCD